MSAPRLVLEVSCQLRRDQLTWASLAQVPLTRCRYGQLLRVGLGSVGCPLARLDRLSSYA